MNKETKATYLKKYHCNESRNHHTENALMLINLFGSESIKEQAKEYADVIKERGHILKNESDFFYAYGHVHYDKLIVKEDEPVDSSDERIKSHMAVLFGKVLSSFTNCIMLDKMDSVKAAEWTRDSLVKQTGMTKLAAANLVRMAVAAYLGELKEYDSAFAVFLKEMIKEGELSI